jgi:hypothetical protein
MIRDLFNKITFARSIDPLVQTNADTAIAGQIVDRQGYESLVYVIETGTLSDANAVFEVKIEEGDAANLSDAAVVAAAQVQVDPGFDGVTQSGQNARFTFAKDNAQLKIGYLGYKRYTKLTITPSGNDSGSAPIAAVAVLSNARHQPAGVTQKP